MYIIFNKQDEKHEPSEFYSQFSHPTPNSTLRFLLKSEIFWKLGDRKLNMWVPESEIQMKYNPSKD